MKDKKVIDSGLTYYDMNKQLMTNERTLDAFELTGKIEDIRRYVEENDFSYLMLLSNERKDYTLFRFSNEADIYSLDKFKNDLRDCLLVRGDVLTISKTEDGLAWEIWIRDNKENFCYYLFDYSTAVLEY